MANLKGVQVTNRTPPPSAHGANHIVPIVGDWVVPASGLTTGDIVEMLPYPAGMVLVSLHADHENLGTAFTAALGIMSGDYLASGARTCDASLVAAATFQAAAIKVANVGGAGRLAPTTNDRSIGLVISGTLTSPVAGAKLRVTGLFRPQVEGV